MRTSETFWARFRLHVCCHQVSHASRGLSRPVAWLERWISSSIMSWTFVRKTYSFKCFLACATLLDPSKRIPKQAAHMDDSGMWHSEYPQRVTIRPRGGASGGFCRPSVKVRPRSLIAPLAELLDTAKRNTPLQGTLQCLGFWNSFKDATFDDFCQFCSFFLWRSTVWRSSTESFSSGLSHHL